MKGTLIRRLVRTANLKRETSLAGAAVALLFLLGVALLVLTQNP